MTAKLETTISINKTLFDQAGMFAGQNNLSQDELFELAIGSFIQNSPSLAFPDETGMGLQDQPDPNKPAELTSLPGNRSLRVPKERTGINQGEIYWASVEEPHGSSAGITHPHVVVQNDVLNHSRIKTIVVCALTTNLKRATAPGNVLFEAGEANLPKQSVVEVSKLATVKKAEVGEYIGSLTKKRLDQILAGMEFLQKSTARH